MTDLLYSDVEGELRSHVRRLLGAHCAPADLLARIESDAPYDPAVWKTLAGDLGVPGLAVPESTGGQGGSWREVAVVSEELGRSLAGTPFLGSSVLATAIAIGTEQPALLRALAAGELTATLAVPLSTAPGAPFPSSVWIEGSRLHGSIPFVADTGPADHLIVPALGPSGPQLTLVPKCALDSRPGTSLDLTRPLATVGLVACTGYEVLADGDAAVAALDGALIAGAAMLASEQLGLAQRCLELTVDYVKLRHQFGRPVGSYQALKHRLADLWTAATQASAVARYAATALATDDPDAAIAASVAQAVCSPLAVRAAEECVQMHGGTGFTWEHPAHLYLKRAKADSIALGTAAWHRGRLGDLAHLPAA